MDQQLKQRLIGVTIIVALVVIFVPMLFDTSDKHSKVTGDNIPPIPDNIVEKSIELPKTAEDLAPKEESKPAETGYRVIPLSDDVPVKKSADSSPPSKNAKPADARDSGEEVALAEEDMPSEGPDDRPAETAKAKPPAKPAAAGMSAPSSKPEAKAEAKKLKPASPESLPVRAEPPVKAEPQAQKPKPTPVPGKAVGAAVKPPDAPAKKAEPLKTAESPKPAVQRSEQPPVSSQAKPAPAQAAPKPAAVAAPAAETAKAMPVPKPAEPTQNPRPATKPSASDKSELASAWVIQAGSFTNEDKAKALAEKLRQSKFAAFVEAVHGDSGSIYRVQVGPELERGRAEQIQRQMESSAGVKGIILPHR
jgi:DedD protein